jgi:hypothetical protein
LGDVVGRGHRGQVKRKGLAERDEAYIMNEHSFF